MGLGLREDVVRCRLLPGVPGNGLRTTRVLISRPTDAVGGL